MEYGPDYPIPVITRDDVRVIERYVKTGKDLPLTADGVKNDIKNAPDTLVTEILKNYKIINTHARSWQKVQDSMITISSVLEYFSQDLHEYGNEAVALVRNMEGYREIKIDTLTNSQLMELPSISIDGNDRIKISSLEQTIQYIKDSINEKKRKSTAALVDLDSFKNTLVNTIEPWVGKMIQVSNPDELDREISNIRRELIRLAQDIVQTQARPSFMQELMGFAEHFSVILMIREAVNAPEKRGGELIKRREDALNKLSADSKLKGVLHSLNIGMGSLYDVVNPAIVATMQLHSHWENIVQLIDDSLDQFKTNTNYAFLGLFAGKLEMLLSDWSSIEKNSRALKNAFRLDIQ